MLSDAGNHGLALTLAHAFFEIDIFLHDRIEISLRVLRRAAGCLKLEDRGAWPLENSELYWRRLQFGMGRAHQCFRATFYFGALHQLNLCAEEILRFLRVNRALGNSQLSRHHHFAGRAIGRRRLISDPSLDKQSEADGQNRNPPAPEQERFVTMQLRNEAGRPRGWCEFFGAGKLHDYMLINRCGT